MNKTKSDIKRLAGVEAVVCRDCQKLHSLAHLSITAEIHVVGGLGDQSNCQVCGLPRGGACITIPHQPHNTMRKTEKLDTITDSQIELMRHEEETLDNILQSGALSDAFPAECAAMHDIKCKIENWLIEQGV